MKKIFLTFFILSFLIISISEVNAAQEVVFRWEKNNFREGESVNIELYQNFDEKYNFTIVSDVVKECWVINDYYSENKIVCRSDKGLCKSIEPINYRYIKCKTWDLYEQNDGERPVLLYEYENEWGRENGVYQAQPIRIEKWTGKITSAGPFMTALIASLVVILIIIGIIYLIGDRIKSFLKRGRKETYNRDLREVKEQIGKKGEVFNNFVVIY